MKIKRLSALFLAVILAASLLSCKDEKNEDDETAKRETAVTTDAETEKADETTANEEKADIKATSLLSIPSSSKTADSKFALEMLEVCTGHTADNTKTLYEKYGYTVSIQRHYDKSADDASHTCGYTVGYAYAEINGKVRPVVLAVIRGTDSGEWLSNFNVAPSGSVDTVYAENFLFAADDVLVGLKSVIDGFENPIVIVSGHSRGAATANLLGTMLDRMLPTEDVFVYTFATPGTVRGTAATEKYENIFNYINPADIVTELPLAAWGFTHAGTDIILTPDETVLEQTKSAVAALAGAVPTINDYYNTKYLLTGAGTGEDGITGYNLMLAVSSMFTGSEESGEMGQAAAMISPESNLYPIIAWLSSGTDAIFAQHMPQVYAELIASK